LKKLSISLTDKNKVRVDRLKALRTSTIQSTIFARMNSLILCRSKQFDVFTDSSLRVRADFSSAE
jgi:hypothetical protein